MENVTQTVEKYKSYAEAAKSSFEKCGDKPVINLSASAIQESVQRALNENEEKRKRKSNIIITGCNLETEHFTSSVQDIINSIFVESTTSRRDNPKVLDCFYLGQGFAGKQRPIKVVFNNETEAELVLSNAHFLRKNNFCKGIYVSPDRTGAVSI